MSSVPHVVKPSEALEELRTKKKDGILTHRQVIDLVGLSRIEIFRRVREKTFLIPIKTGIRNIGWHANEIFKWIDSLPRVEYSFGTNGCIAPKKSKRGGSR